MLLLKWMKPTVSRDKFGDIKECFWNMSSLSLHRMNMHCIILNHVPMRSINKNVEQKSYDFNFIWSTNCLNQHSKLWKHDHSLFYNSSKILMYWMFIFCCSNIQHWCILVNSQELMPVLRVPSDCIQLLYWHGYTWIINWHLFIQSECNDNVLFTCEQNTDRITD